MSFKSLCLWQFVKKLQKMNTRRKPDKTLYVANCKAITIISSFQGKASLKYLPQLLWRIPRFVLPCGYPRPMADEEAITLLCGI